MLDNNVEYSISETSEITGYATHVLRYYEKEFDIEIPRKDSNHRYYTFREIELIQYIKSLQEQGFSNKQIKIIINSPQSILSPIEGNSLQIKEGKDLNINISDMAMEISKSLEENFFEKLSVYMEEKDFNNTNLIQELKDEIISLRHEMNSKERDILICENAKLKMKVKEKIYENIKLKDKIQILENKNISFFKKIFNISKAKI